MAPHEESDALQHLLDISIKERSGSKICVRRLSRVTDAGVHILSDVYLDSARGSIVGIIGPSGSGKSTFLRALNRLWEPPAETVFLDGEDITKMNVVSLRRRIGMLFQTPALFEGTVADNVRYGPQLSGRKLEHSQVVDLLKVVDLEPSFAEKLGNELSVGQAQRVALARALANEPEVLLLDEPTSALDPVSSQYIEGSILHLSKEMGLTVVLVSHSMKQIQRMADIVYILVNGEIVEVVKPAELGSASHPLAQMFLAAS